ncbi:glucose-6-phosphate dehydrogenase [Yunchengibacter salinarum]|uniref:glucose-6-phosphate dehydrogenase n=1 Tax=Yunchengibacter salinarum TaxID=3133399 RepID=UPI0035B5CEBE
MTQSFDLIIFGGAGDLSRKKLLPALFNGFCAGYVPADSRIYVTSRSDFEQSVADWLKEVFAETPPRDDIDAASLKSFAKIVHPVTLNLTAGDDQWARLSKEIESSADRPLVHFLAIPPKIFTSTCALLGEYGLNGPHARLVLEKPIGHDLESARAINADVAQHFREDQVFRIDHYLGKEAVQNLLALRFSNILFEEVWNNRTVDHIQITLAEDQGVAGRGAFYEGTGALRDMVQSHQLQLLCLTAMEPPARLDADSIREEKLKVLKSLEPLSGADIDANVVRAQYGSGAVNGQAVPGYMEDLELEGESDTESFVAIKTHIENWRWAGVPFYLRTGKRLPDRFAEIVIQFKDVPHSPNAAWGTDMAPNRFIIRMQPQDHLAFRMMVKHRGTDHDRLKEVELNLDVAANQGAPRMGPYLRLILDAARGDQSLFVHRDEVEHAWAWADRIISHWEHSGRGMKAYQAGTWGPYEAHDLMARDGRAWFNENHGVS